MGFLDELKSAFAPHADNLNRTIGLHGALIQQRLANIERGVTAPTVADKWFRISVNQEVTGPIELATVPLNEVWPLQALVVDGVFVKSPAFVLEAANRLIASVIKEGVGTEKLGGDLVALPGEVITLTPRATGQISLCLHVVRKPLTVVGEQRLQMGKSTDFEIGRNTHDPARDMIPPRVQYVEPPAEVTETPPLKR